MNKDTDTPVPEALVKLRQAFAASLPERMGVIQGLWSALRLQWTPEGFEQIHRAVHSLTGAAGTFGMPSISDAARQLERLLNQARAGQDLQYLPETEIEQGIMRLEQLTRIRLESDAPSLKPPPAAPRFDRSPLIYLVEDDREQATHMAQELRDEGYRVRIFNDIQSFQNACVDPAEEAPAALLMDMIFPEGENAGTQIVEKFKQHSRRCPPVVFISVRDDIMARLNAFRAGASRYLVKPIAPKRVIDVLDGLTGRQPPQPYRVLLVDDDPLLLQAQSAVLESAGMEVRSLSEPLKLFDALNSFTPDVVVLDVYMPDASGPELAAVLRERDDTLDTPILFLSAETDMSKQLLALNLGGDDFLVKPVLPEHLIAAVTARARRMRQNSVIRQRLQTTLYEREREHLAVNEHAIVSIADAAGNITYVNDRFCDISGYTRGELIGQNHRIVKSGEHDEIFYHELWQSIGRGKVWQGEICNRSKSGRLYWVESTIVPFLDGDGKPYQYVSMRTDVTHIKQTQAALRASEERLQFLVSNSPVTIYTSQATPPFGATFISQNITQMLGYPAEQFTQDSAFWQDHIHPDDQQRILSDLMHLFDTGEHVHEYRFLHQDGRYVWVHDELRLMRDDEGRPQEIIGYWMDISARKEAEEAAEDLKERLRRGQYYANIGTWDWNITTGELHWTERISTLFGYPSGELETSYENFIAAVHPEDRAALQAAVQACIDHDAPYEIEHRVVWPDGTVRWLLERGAVVRDASGNPLQMLGVVMDIDDRKRAEMLLRETEERFAFAVEGAGDGVWDWDMRSNDMRFSRQYMEMLGYGEHELPHRLETWTSSVHPDDMPRAQRILQDYLEGRSPAYEVELRLRCKDGSYKWILCRGTIVNRDENGKPLRMIGIHSEISARKQAEQALILAREEADRANQAKSEFLSSMSHELRTPMNAILGFGQLIEYDEKLSDEQRDNVREILKAGNHLLNLINEVLDLAKVEAGRIDLSIEVIEVCSVVEECLSLVSALADQRHITMGHQGLPGKTVRADRTRLRQTLLNLLSNAIKYNREGGRVDIELHQPGEQRLRILVRDTGPGIPENRMSELFQPFNRLGAESSEVEGTGIGLTITQRMVEMMGGSVGAESTLGVGSTFWIELPLENTVASAKAVSQEHEQDALVMRNEPSIRRTILYIEDNPANLKLVAQILGTRSHIDLKTAHTADLGLELAQAHRPDLILLDINMPDMDGYQVLKVFKADARLKEIPVLAVTANAMPNDVDRGFAAGFTEYLTKPLNVNKFLATIDRCLPG